jgi:ankyrin repeat protein
MNAARLFVVLLLPIFALAQPPTPTRDLGQYLQDGLFEEEANRNLDKASAAYEALIDSFDKDRQFAATAVFRLAEIRVKQNRKDDAIALFQRVITEFGNDPLAKLSRVRLTTLGGKAPAPGEGSVDDAEAREIAMLQEIVKNSPDLLNSATTGEGTPLTRAAAKGWLKAATFLLDHGANPNPKGTTPALVAAAYYGRKAMTELLLARGADPNAKDLVLLHGTALMAAVSASHIEVVRVLLEHGALPNERISTNNAPLHIASAKGNVDLARLLLDKGADVNLVSDQSIGSNQYTGTPLMAAVRGRHLDVAKLLLAYKADPNINSSIGSGALRLAISNVDVETAELLLKNGANANADESLREAVIQGDTDLVRLLAKYGADINTQDSTGTSPFHSAMKNPSVPLEVAEWLLAHGADANLKDKKGATPLTSAPMDRRLWLEERISFPAWTKDRAIHTVIRFPMFSSLEPLRTVPVADFDIPPPISELVSQAARQANELQYGIPNQLAVAVYRSNRAGGVVQTENITINPAANEKLSLPGLRWGDLIVVYGPTGTERTIDNRKVRTFRVATDKPDSRKVSVQVGERRRDITMSGDGAEWAPANGSFPKWDFSQVVANLVAAEPRAQLEAVKVQRDVDGKVKEWTVDLRPENPNSALKNVPARLADGDRIIVPLLPENDPGALAVRKTGIYRTAPGRLFGECVFRFSEKDNAPRTLGDLIAESYLTSQMVIPDPDFARIQIHRLKQDSAAEELLEINLIPAIQQVTVDTPGTEARKLDVPLKPGDIVEIAPRKDSKAEPWTGFSNAVKLFLTKALMRQVTYQLAPQAPTTGALRPSFAIYREIKTESGNRWEHSSGAPPFRATTVISPNDSTLKVRLRSGETVREFTLKEFQQVNPWLVEGDRLETEQW